MLELERYPHGSSAIAVSCNSDAGSRRDRINKPSDQLLLETGSVSDEEWDKDCQNLVIEAEKAVHTLPKTATQLG